MHPSELADRYFAAVRARDIDAFMALFASDAILVRPDGGEVVGHDAIRAFELFSFENSAPYPTLAVIVVGNDSVAVEIQVTLPDGRTLRMADFFQLDGQGLIRRLSVYRQG